MTAVAVTEEARQFAGTVAVIAARHTGPDPWRPGAAASDAHPELNRALSEAGWDELGRDKSLHAFDKFMDVKTTWIKLDR